MKRITVHNKGITVSYRLTDRTYLNNHNLWRCKEDWFFRIAFENKWWNIDSVKYDGHYVNTIILLGIQLGLGYTYDSRPLKGWHSTESRLK